MNDLEQALAETLTRVVVDVPGVRGIYPQSVIAAATAGLVRSSRSAATGLLRVQQQGERLRITARLAVDSTSRTEDVVAAVRDALRAELAERPFALHVEIAHID